MNTPVDWDAITKLMESHQFDQGILVLMDLARAGCREARCSVAQFVLLGIVSGESHGMTVDDAFSWLDELSRSGYGPASFGIAQRYIGKVDSDSKARATYYLELAREQGFDLSIIFGDLSIEDYVNAFDNAV